MKFVFITWWNAAIQISVFAWDVYFAAFDFHRHKIWMGGIMSFCAAFVFGFNFWSWYSRRRVMMRAMQMQAAQRFAQHYYAQMAQILPQGLDPAIVLQFQQLTEERTWGAQAMATAKEHLAMVMKAVGAEWIDREIIEMKVGKIIFRVQNGSAFRGLRSDYMDHSTCWQHAPMPTSEAIASVLLLLKNDPKIFDRWNRREGWVIDSHTPGQPYLIIT